MSRAAREFLELVLRDIHAEREPDQEQPIRLVPERREDKTYDEPNLKRN